MIRLRIAGPFIDAILIQIHRSAIHHTVLCMMYYCKFGQISRRRSAIVLHLVGEWSMTDR